MAQYLIAGAGYVGIALALKLAAKGEQIFLLRRSPLDLGELKSDPILQDGTILQDSPVDLQHPELQLSQRLPELLKSITCLQGDLCKLADLVNTPAGFDRIVYLAAPGEFSDEAYKAVYFTGIKNLLESVFCKSGAAVRFLLASSTRVYHQTDGEVVDESSLTLPTDFAGKRLLQAEQLVASLGPAGISIRFGGIYDQARNRMIDKARLYGAAGGSTRFTNRIHRHDCASIMAFLSELEAPENTYIGVDTEPCTEREVLQWLSGVLGVSNSASHVNKDSAVTQSPTTNRSASSKRCSSARPSARRFQI